MDVEGSWKGKIWLLFFVWTIFGYSITKYCIQTGAEYYVVYIVVIILAWLCWLFGLVRLIKLLKSLR